MVVVPPALGPGVEPGVVGVEPGLVGVGVEPRVEAGVVGVGWEPGVVEVGGRDCVACSKEDKRRKLLLSKVPHNGC